MKIDIKLKPSAIGQYFETECCKHLVRHSIDDKQLELLGWNASAQTETSSIKAGNDWESIVLNQLESDMESGTCQVIKINKHDDFSASIIETINALRSLNDTETEIYIYQACINATVSFNDAYLSCKSNKSTSVQFSKCMYPDFIKAVYDVKRNQYSLTVIDVKNSGHLKIGAEIQIALYAKILKHFISDNKIENCYINEEKGIVWNREYITNNRICHEFQMNDAIKELDKFFKETIPGIITTVDICTTSEEVTDTIDYRISHKCEYCENFDICRSNIINKKSSRVLPYINITAQDRLTDLITRKELPDDSLDSVISLLKNKPDFLTDDCSYWKRINDDITAYENGMLSVFNNETAKYPKSGTSVTLPASQDFSLILTAQQDIISGRAYAFSWLLKSDYIDDVLNKGNNIDLWNKLNNDHDITIETSQYFNSLIAENNSNEEFDKIERNFIERIYSILKKIDELNVTNKKFQIFIMDDYERINIENAFYNVLSDPEKDIELSEKAMSILFWMQGERLVTDSGKQPERTVTNPLTILSTEISRLYVLSQSIAYSLRETAKILSPEFNFSEEDNLYFQKLSNTIPGMIFENIVSEQTTDSKKALISNLDFHLRKRLLVESSIITSIQKECADKLGTVPMQYAMSKSVYDGYPEIASLDFQNRLEQLLAYRQYINARAIGVESAIENGTILQIKYTGVENEYSVLNSDTYEELSWFKVCMCEDTSENRNKIMCLRDIDDFYFEDFILPYNLQIQDDKVIFKVAKKYNFKPKNDSKYLLFELYQDINSLKSAAGLARTIMRPELLNPELLSASTNIIYDTKVQNLCDKFSHPDNKSFSLSQENAFKHLLEQKLTILKGPPASGKTDFISRALITISLYYKKVYNRNLKIMVTANSHSAIDNVLSKIIKMTNYAGIPDISILKLKRTDSELLIPHIIKDGDANNLLKEDSIQIMGMTCWSAYNAFHGEYTLPEFDIIVMDESSQIRAIDSFISLECSGPETRFLIVGDNDQLSPIIHGKYKRTEGKKYIHGSVFDMFLTGLGENHPDVIMLSDNFRMNGILCRHSANEIYGDEYQAANDAIRDQKINLKDKSNDPLIASILDEEYPLVYCELSGLAKNQSDAETNLVSRVVSELWESLAASDNSVALAKDAGNFWNHAIDADNNYLEGQVGIISPHHSHINKLKKSIACSLNKEKDDIYIGTVDKLQGQERKVVIVSYGVYEQEKIKNESEFIFSRNRFNVSITRGKAKTIVILSETIARSNIKTNILKSNDDSLAEGINFIHNFASYMENELEDEKLIAEEHVFNDISIKVWKKKLNLS